MVLPAVRCRTRGTTRGARGPSGTRRTVVAPDTRVRGRTRVRARTGTTIPAGTGSDGIGSAHGIRTAGGIRYRPSPAPQRILAARSAEDSELIRATMTELEGSSDAATAYFYALLFVQNPHLREMFPPRWTASATGSSARC